MLEDEQKKAIAIFFYYALQDEKLATQATVSSLQKLRKRRNSSQGPSEILNVYDSDLVLVSFQTWQRFKKKIQNTQSAVSTEGGWLPPEDFDLGPWRQFRKDAIEEEFLIVLWSKVLKLPDRAISKGLGITEGTVRYRVGRALRTLGKMAGDAVHG